MSDSVYDVFVIGGGVAGLTTAELAARGGFSTCVAEETVFGGLVLNVNHLRPGVEGLPDSGADLAAELMSRVSDLGAMLMFEPVTAIEAAGDGMLRVTTAAGTHRARCVIVASGARLRRLGVPGESEFENCGVSHCADCDGPMYRGETAVVVGGGDSALQEVLVLAEFCSTVHLVHRGADFSGRADLALAVRAASKVKLHLQTVVDAIVGDRAVNGVRIRQLASGEVSELPCKGVFSYIGLEPNVTFLPAEMQTAGATVRVDELLETSLPNVFAIGAVREGHAGQIDDAVRDARAVVGTIAARFARA